MKNIFNSILLLWFEGNRIYYNCSRYKLVSGKPLDIMQRRDFNTNE